MSERKLASVRIVEDVQPIPGADAIEVATVGGWKVVVKKGEYSPGDLAIYFEIDSWIPHKIAPFLSKGSSPRVYKGVAGEKLKTIKLRGQISQGLLLPVKKYDPKSEVGVLEWFEIECNGNIGCPEVELGQDVTELLGVQKWEMDIPAQLAGQMRGSFPSWARKTDQERCQNLKKEIKKAFDENVKFEVSIKLDGSSMSVGFSPDGEFTICSRNLSLKTDQEGNSFVEMARKLKLEEKLKGLDGYMFSGELIGMGINGNWENLDHHEFYIFDIFDGNKGVYLSPEDRVNLVSKLGLNHVPILHHNASLRELNLQSVEEILEFAEGKSLYSPIREGVVFKSECGQFSFKGISNKFLLKKGE